jgi:hypothetical protein
MPIGPNKSQDSSGIIELTTSPTNPQPGDTWAILNEVKGSGESMGSLGLTYSMKNFSYVTIFLVSTTGRVCSWRAE